MKTGGKETLEEFVESHRSSLLSKLTEHGAILFRNFDVDDAMKFSAFVCATGGRNIDYRFRSTPRTLVAGQIYTSTEYPASREIPLHNENSYYRVWPRKIAFACIVPATRGGETPIADMRDVSRSLGPALVDEFEKMKVRYIRHFHPGIDLPWADVFQTSSAAEVARFCDKNDIQHEWLGDDRAILRTRHISQGVAYHPITSERLFFNQAHLFHSTSMGREVEKMMRDALGQNRLPRHSMFGNDTEIADDTIAAINSAFSSNETPLVWRKGDVLWIDNMQIAHGRRPFSGSRKILASLMDASSD